MTSLIDRSTRPVLILGGLATALVGVASFLPRFAVENVQRLEWVSDYTIFVQHWAFMVGLVGVFMIAAAFIPSWRTPVVLFTAVEKAFMVFLVVSNSSEEFASGFIAPAVVDGTITLWCLLYLVTRART
ncbi:MAG: hypothetical protein AAF726_09795 [Planctomycetota bacterium]